MQARIQRKKTPILMYHSISCNASSKFRQFTVSPTSFAEQMAYLHQQAYTPITVTQYIRARSERGNVLPERPVVLTFDDGFADFFTVALPVLKEHDFAATLYISSKFIDGTSYWLRHEGETTRRMLTWKQLAEIAMSGIECGAHSHSHPQLDILSYNQARDEILESKRLLEDHLGREVLSFAYPFGYHSTQVRNLVREAGYTSACAVRHAMSSETDDPFSLARFMVRANCTMEEFAALLIGRSSSPLTAAYKIYLRIRTPVWQFARRFAASVTKPLNQRRFEGGLI